ncbi:AMP-dependent synthetase/ligase [Mycolicibacterium aubagnense]|uniref:Acyl-CoA synthetase n=1 Tax=Mycolicibacterium aubagnense TaxID=319707 RepID=A0ABN5YPQ1_9MYCO|nr:long-chain fatty acid--CoA ligase [Mycolicibacterium aubagnense]TLH59677.1 long-chain fatty acid--CoA ligase [Mycolicibacterium aubagnense]WGI34469.1 long-chain fatty acid--CoA ligase [Mycolicibacterium aubagnense]BBX83663.1 putative fatty-acid-CoA ligase FadD [Mycolicibacterium aubagnense]
MSESLCAHFQRRVAELGDTAAICHADGTVALTWSQYGAEVRRVAAGLAGLGVRRGDVVAMMLTNRSEFHVVDAAVMHLGAVGFSVYNTSATAQISYLFENAEPVVVVSEAQYLEKVLAAASGTGVRHVVSVDESSHGVLTLDEVTACGADDFDFDAAWKAVQRDDILTLIYTSGTTGHPKGVELTHANLLYQLEVIPSVVGNLASGRVLSYLPDAHLINRWIGQYAPMYFGITVTDVGDPKTLVDVLGRVHPTFFVAVPMLWYKIRARIEALIAEQAGPAGALARWALTAGKKKAAATLAGGRLGLLDEAAAAAADVLVLSKIRSRLGLDQLSAAVSGAAPIDVSVLEFMLAIGVPVLEAWGMSETSAVTTVNPRDRIKLGTVGKPIPGTQIKLDSDGEILVRGCGVMRGYHRDPDRTADILDTNGWIHTGDIGSLDAEGYLRIVDRKKELIINSGGKNMSPSNIEGALKAASSLIGAVAAIGDNRPHIAALITLDPDAAAEFADRHGLRDTAIAELVDSEAIQRAVSEAVTLANARLSRVEQIRSWKVLPQYWIPGSDELTPTLKLRRAPIAEKYAAQIDALYARLS